MEIQMRKKVDRLKKTSTKEKHDESKNEDERKLWKNMAWRLYFTHKLTKYGWISNFESNTKETERQRK